MYLIKAPKTFQKTRIAPTPSGYLHLGNLASFILTCRIARLHGAEIILRIDDLDQQRVRKEYLEDIFETLTFFGLPIDEGPRSVEEHLKQFSQTHRRSFYAEALDELLKNGLVYACECSRSLLNTAENDKSHACTCKNKSIPVDAPNMSWRVNTESANPIALVDLNLGKRYFKFPSSMKDFVIRKKDGEAAYQLASVVDDLYFNINLIVRGEDLFDSTLAQLFISSQLANQNFSPTTFFHHPLLVSEQSQKLSKSAGDTSIMQLRKSGLSSNDILNLLGRMLQTKSNFSNWEELGDWLIDNWGNKFSTE